MSQDTRAVRLAQASFSGRDELVARAFKESPAFRDLCRDYRRCLEALHRFKKQEATEPPPRWQEYTELLLELGQEIQTWLDALEAAPTRPEGDTS